MTKKENTHSCSSCITVRLIKHILEMPIEQQNILLAQIKNYNNFVKEMGRRENTRMFYNGEIKIRLAGQIFKGIAENISANGMSIKSDMSPNTGDVIKLTFPVNENEIMLNAEVVRVESDKFSVQFKDMIDTSYFI